MNLRGLPLQYGTAAAILLLGCLTIFTGCESDSASSPVKIEPSNVQMLRGQRREFKASGGYDYRWSIENNAIGLIEHTSDESRVFYTAIGADESNEIVQVLRLDSRAKQSSGSSSENTNDTDGSSETQRVKTEAYIVHLPDPSAPPPAESEPLALDPSGTVTMGTNNLNQVFRVSGGRPDYQWSLSDADETVIGALEVFFQTTAIYTRGKEPGAIVIRVRDRDGKTAEAAIIQSGSLP